MQLTGTVVAEGRVLAPSINQVELDLTVDMAVTAARSAGSPTTFSHTQDLLAVALDRTYATGEVFSVEIDYHGNPAGESFGWDSHGGQPMIWTLSEPFGAREWWPCKDQPADKADAVDIRATVNQNLVVASNGKLMSVTPNGTQHTYHWHESYPITTYLVSLAIYPYAQYSDWYRYSPADSMEIQFFVYPDQLGSVQENYAKTKNMIAVYASLFGEYPFITEKYGHASFEWGGGMEHQTCTSLGGWGESLIAHELTHMWWGDHVTCNSFHHIWLNEGFATYGEALWWEATLGEQAMHADMAANAYYGPGTIYVEDPGNFNEIFNSNLSYRKASWVLHMLRHAVGDDDFFDILRSYYTVHGGGTATTEQFQAVAETVSGQDLNAFFQQWIYGEGFPVYSYQWTAEPAGSDWEITLDIDQLQTNQVFVMPIDIEIEFVGGGSQIQVVQNNAASQQVLLTVAAEPAAVRLDPDNWILRQLLVPLENPTFDQGVLVVNGVSWTSYGSEILQAYEARAFWGDHDIAFWDLFPAPSSYPSTLPPPLGHGAVDPAVMGRYSSVVWVGNNYDGDLALWFNSPNLSYVAAGGNLLLMTRMGQDFFIDPLREYLGIEWTAAQATLSLATSTYTGLGHMTRTSTQNYAAIFDRDRLGPETTLLFVDTAFNPDAGIGAWRTSTGGGEFVFLSGRPYRWNHAALHDNTDFILREIFGEGASSAVGEPEAVAGYRLQLGDCMPNPMTPSTRIPFELPAAGPASIKIYDPSGRLVRTLFDGSLKAGPQILTWDGRSGAGRPAGSGVYYVRLDTPAGKAEQSVILIR